MYAIVFPKSFPLDSKSFQEMDNYYRLVRLTRSLGKIRSQSGIKLDFLRKVMLSKQKEITNE